MTSRYCNNTRCLMRVSLQSCGLVGKLNEDKQPLVPSLRRALQWDCGDSDDIEGVGIINRLTAIN